MPVVVPRCVAAYHLLSLPPDILYRSPVSLPFSFAQGGEPAEPPEPTVFCIDLDGLCADGTLNEYAPSRSYRPDKEMTGTLLARFPHVPASGAQLSTWLNDLFSPPLSPRSTVRAGPAAATAANL